MRYRTIIIHSDPLAPENEAEDTALVVEEFEDSDKGRTDALLHAEVDRFTEDGLETISVVYDTKTRSVIYTEAPENSIS